MTTRNLDPDAGWVRVEDAMPDGDEDVLVFTSGKNQYTGHFMDDHWCDDWGHPLDVWPSTVTHWRNPPAPPKEGE